MRPGLQAVADFIVQMAVTEFNEQFGYKFNWKDFKIVSLPEHVMGKCAYEISNPAAYDDVRLHIYAHLGNDCVIRKFRLEDEKIFPTGPSEKVYVAIAEFNDHVLRLDNNFIRRQCPHFPSFVADLNILIMQTGQPLLDQDHEYIFLASSGNGTITGSAQAA